MKIKYEVRLFKLSSEYERVNFQTHTTLYVSTLNESYLYTNSVLCRLVLDSLIKHREMLYYGKTKIHG